MYLTYRWNLIYQYELNKLGSFHYLQLPNSLPWNFSARPLAASAQYVDLEELNLKQYKAFVLHFDENILNPGKHVRSEFGEIFRRLLNLPIKKVLVCHGAPPIVGRLDPEYYLKETVDVDQTAKRELETLLQDELIVFPNERVRSEWNFAKSVVIEPTLSHYHYPYIPKTRNRFITVAPDLAIRPQYAGYKLFEKAALNLNVAVVGKDPAGIGREIAVPDIQLYSHLKIEDASKKRFYDYMNVLGTHSAYLNTHLREPWNYSLYEAMLLGMAVVSTNHYEESKLIKNGLNGFASNDPFELRNFVVYLLTNSERAREMGMEARASALKKFSVSDFHEKWNKVLE